MPPKKKAIRPPRIDLDPQELGEWLEIKKVPGKGDGLYARQDLKRNTRFPYEGKEIDQKQYDKLTEKAHKHPSKAYLCYILGLGRKGRFIDAHPRYSGSDLWFASKANEPDQGETANMILLGGLIPSLVLIRDVQAGEALTYCYGSRFMRVGYKKGRCPPKPKWI